MSDDPSLLLAFQRFIAMMEANTTASTSAQITQKATGMAGDLAVLLEAHNRANRGVHGIGPGNYVVKTRNPGQFVEWTEIVGRPSLTGGIDPTLLELDGAQITTGTVNVNRLPVAGLGVSDATKLVRSDDPRLTSRAWTCEAGEMLAQGSVVTGWADGRCGLASASSADTAGVGVVAESYGLGQQATIWPFGEAEMYLLGVTSADIPKPVYLSTVPGRVSLTMPSLSPGVIIQSIGAVIGVISTTVARVAVCISAVEEVA